MSARFVIEKKVTPDREVAATTLPIVESGATLPEVVPDHKTSLVTMLPGGTALTALRSAMKKEHKMVFGASYQVSSGSAGVTNQVITNAMLSALPEFKNCTPIFQEFFVSKFVVLYEPASRYSKRSGSTSAADSNDVPLVVVDLQHSQAPYATHNEACSNSSLIVATSCDPWKFTWRNTENKMSGVVPASGASSSSPIQAWCPTDLTSANLYSGTVQIMSPPALVNPTLNLLYGTVVVRWEVLFRCRA